MSTSITEWLAGAVLLLGALLVAGPYAMNAQAQTATSTATTTGSAATTTGGAATSTDAGTATSTGSTATTTGSTATSTTGTTSTTTGSTATTTTGTTSTSTQGTTSTSTTTMPVITNVAVTPTMNSASIAWTTNMPATSSVSYGTTSASMATTTIDTSLKTSHIRVLTGLLPNTTYTFQVLSGGATSTAASSQNLTFTTLAATSSATTTPVISAVNVTPATTSAAISWTTDVPTSAQIRYGTTEFLGASTTLDTSMMTSHLETLFGLLPNTLYHFVIDARNATGTLATSSHRTFTTLGATTTATTTPQAPVLSNILATPGTTTASVSWTTDVPTTGTLLYGTNEFFGATSTTASSTTVHAHTLFGLAPNTQYHYQVQARNSSGTLATSTHRTFTTLASGTTTATSTASTTDVSGAIAQLTTRIAALEQLITMLNQKIDALIAKIGTGGMGTTTPPATGTGAATIDQNGRTFGVGSPVDFGGRNFGREETVSVSLAGQIIANAHADGGGNFSTGSMRVPTTAGTYTYVFTGLSSGRTVSATITVQ